MSHTQDTGKICDEREEPEWVEVNNVQPAEFDSEEEKKCAFIDNASKDDFHHTKDGDFSWVEYQTRKTMNVDKNPSFTVGLGKDAWDPKPAVIGALNTQDDKKNDDSGSESLCEWAQGLPSAGKS
ncbi:hypothetical protein BBP40_010222 [Aspergillus hancockii]|nr:hypothetical protein BBP40_010222 [Aspergillus hancockii]